MEVEVTNGQNIIRLLYDEFVSCLVIESALTVNWPDCAGSVGEYYSMSNYSSEKRKALTESLNQLLIDGEENELLVSVKKFLNLFSNGYYKLTLNTLQADKTFLFHEDIAPCSKDTPKNKRFTGWLFPSFDNEHLFFTIPKKTIDADRVSFYKELIKKGKKPRVITYQLFTNEGYTARYIIDGHHKTLAYNELGLEIPTVTIEQTKEGDRATGEILKYSSYILKDFEFEHLFIENDENLENVNFVNDSFLTSKLDEILSKRARLGIGIIKLFLKLDNSQDDKSLHWLIERLKVLSKNQTIGKGLILRYFGFSTVLNCDCWIYDEINDNKDFNNWINKVLPNNGYNA